jgi:peroxiredoxin Q/BCP
MASTDNLEDVTGFARMHEANFPILSDKEKSMSRDYGVLSAMGYAKRWTYYIDSAGMIVHIDTDVSPSSAGPDLAENLKRLGFPERN